MGSTTLDRCLAAIAALVAIEMLPLPASVIDVISPHARTIRQGASLTSLPGQLPISVNPLATAWALGIFASVVAVFLVSRQVLAQGGVRIVIRGIATVGLLLSAVALAQDATAHGLIYWRWKPPFEVAAPFGPFLNRNHFATWVVMAVPVSLAYLLARGSAHAGRRNHRADWRQATLSVMDARSIWLAAAICLMLVGLAASLSRAGMVGMVAAVGIAGYLRGRNADGPASGWAKAAIVLALLAALIRINPVELYHRFSVAGVAAAGRIEIWRATLPVVKDFWLTGTGAGTFETVMLAYQQTPSLFRINAAHNQYLQIAAEGGAMIGLPVAIALGALGRAARRALERDRSGVYLLRAGAFSGLAGAAVQSVWETGLSTPANALLAAVLAAILLHRSPETVSPSD